MTRALQVPRRVLHVFGTMDRGGAELRTLEVVRTLDPQVVQSHFLTLSGRAGALDDEIRAVGGAVHPCRLGPGFRRRFRDVLDREAIDVVHSHVADFSGLILREAQKAGITLRVAHYRSTSDGRSTTVRRRLQRRLMKRWLRRYSTSILAVSEGVMAGCMGSTWQADPRARVVYNGLDLAPYATAPPDARRLREELGLPLDGPLLIHVGNHTPAKNHGRLIQVFQAARQKRGDLSLLLVGAGADLPAMAAQAGAGRVVAAGSRQDVPRLLLASDLLVLPSVREGLPGSVLEACAAGLPVLASDLPGAKEIARHFPAVHVLGLAESDDAWAARILDIVAADLRVSPRQAAERFRETPFTLPSVRQELLRAWGADI